MGVTEISREMVEKDHDVGDLSGYLFLAAAERMRSNTSLQLSDKQRLELYGYYKQVTGNKSL